jgi:hypothetical protein
MVTSEGSRLSSAYQNYQDILARTEASVTRVGAKMFERMLYGARPPAFKWTEAASET